MDVVGSVMNEQGVQFAVIQVHAYTVEHQSDAEDAIRTYGQLFPGLPVVIMTVGTDRPPTYWGRSDLANYMARLPTRHIPWRKFSFARS